MLLASVLFGTFGLLLADLLGLYSLVVVVMCVMSFFPLRPGTGAAKVFRVLQRLTDPVLIPLRQALPAFGSVDISPVILLMGIYLLRMLILG